MTADEMKKEALVKHKHVAVLKGIHDANMGLREQTISSFRVCPMCKESDDIEVVEDVKTPNGGNEELQSPAAAGAAGAVGADMGAAAVGAAGAAGAGAGAGAAGAGTAGAAGTASSSSDAAAATAAGEAMMQQNMTCRACGHEWRDLPNAQAPCGQ